jgi:CRISPR/Cas system CMR-associated protein Cmr1 (group 7 of RAMP superfamily)
MRQGEGVGRNMRGDAGRPGRSFWPEADSVRSVERQGKRDWWKHDVKHPSVSPTTTEGFYPRAAFGLPLQLKFRGETDPEEAYQVLPKDKPLDRWPSPIHLKVVKLSDGSLRRLCLVLNARIPDLALCNEGGRLKQLTQNEHPSNPSHKRILALPSKNMNTDPYVLLFAHMKTRAGIEDRFEL